MEGRMVSLTGNEAAAWAVRLARARVAFSFPMGPNAEVTETLQNFIDKGEVKDLKIIFGDNEKASTSMQIGTARTGVRSMSCINSEGLLWATAEIHYAASSRLPLLLVCPSRALEPPTTVLCDHDDFIAQRDMGWLMFYCENPQDVLDTILQVYKIIEDGTVMLPAVVGYDGWETSHASVRVILPEQAAVDQFLPPPSFINPEKDYFRLDWKEKCKQRRTQMGYGSPYFMDLRYLQKKAEEDSIRIIEKVGLDYQTLFGSPHVGLLESHRCEDAEVILITMGIVHPSVKFVVNALREKGVRIGCIKLRVFRPFPAEALLRVVKDARLLITIDRNSVAALFHEIRGSLYSLIRNGSPPSSPFVIGRVMGIGGIPIGLDHIGRAIEDGLRVLQDGFVKKELEWFPIQGIQFDPTRDTIAE